MPDEATDEHWMRVALAEAQRAGWHDDVPVGCVILGPEGKLLGRGRNRRELDQDPTAHAEIVAARAAAAAHGHWRLENCTLYVTLEPCAMCAGALVNARLGRLVYGATDPKAGAIASLYSLGSDPRLNHRFPHTAGVLEAECAELLRAFFRKLRASGQK